MGLLNVLDKFDHFPERPLRPASQVMRLRRMGAMFPTRLSFLRTLHRRMAQERVTVSRPVWKIDADGFGHAVYTLELGGYAYSLVAVSTDLPPELRSDRVIATAWDSAYVLYDGVPDADEIARIVSQAPLQEAGRFTARDLVLSRANKSVRLFDHVVESLRAGEQPDKELVRSTGYLMRTTAVYGNGKFGIADRADFATRPGLEGPFMAEMLTVWLIRGFTHDLAEHVGGAPLDREIKRHLGIGNSTGLGMAPFLVSHPVLIDAWVYARETAIARVRAVEFLEMHQIDALYTLLERAAAHLAEWNVPDPLAMERISVIRREWLEVAAWMKPEKLIGSAPLDDLVTQSAQWSVDTQELIVAMCIEPFGDLVDGLTDCMSTPFVPVLDPRMDCKDLRGLIQTHARWALSRDYSAKEECAQFWYVSQEKLEPRLGDRHAEAGSELESPLDIGRRINDLHRDLEGHKGKLAAFLADQPEHRFAARRVQSLAHHPYSEIRDNLIGDGCLPVDMLRCKLSFFGASKFDPKSDRWTRITLAQGAPLADELGADVPCWLPVYAA